MRLCCDVNNQSGDAGGAELACATSSAQLCSRERRARATRRSTPPASATRGCWRKVNVPLCNGTLRLECNNNKRIGSRHVFDSVKLPLSRQGFNATLAAVSEALRDLRTDWLDLLLSQLECDNQIQCEGTWEDSWRALELLKASVARWLARTHSIISTH